MANPSSPLHRPSTDSSVASDRLSAHRCTSGAGWQCPPSCSCSCRGRSRRSARSRSTRRSTQLLIERDTRRQTSIDAVLDDRGSGYYDDGFYRRSTTSCGADRWRCGRSKRSSEAGRPEQRARLAGNVVQARRPRRRGEWAGDGAPERRAPVEGRVAAETVEPGRRVGRRNRGAVGENWRASSAASAWCRCATRASSTLAFRSPDPDYAARAVNELANQYRMRNLESTVPRLEGSQRLPERAARRAARQGRSERGGAAPLPRDAQRGVGRRPSEHRRAEADRAERAGHAREDRADRQGGAVQPAARDAQGRRLARFDARW